MAAVRVISVGVTMEVRYERGPFKSSTSEHPWLLLGAYENGQLLSQIVVRLSPEAADDDFGLPDSFWGYVARAGADRLHRDGRVPAAAHDDHRAQQRGSASRPIRHQTSAQAPRRCLYRPAGMVKTRAPSGAAGQTRSTP